MKFVGPSAHITGKTQKQKILAYCGSWIWFWLPLRCNHWSVCIDS